MTPGCETVARHIPVVPLGRRSGITEVELSYTAQFYKYLRTFLDLPEGRTRVFKRSGGKDLTGDEVLEEIKRLQPGRRSDPGQRPELGDVAVQELPGLGGRP